MSEREALLWIHIALKESYPGPVVGKCTKGFASVCACICECVEKATHISQLRCFDNAVRKHVANEAWRVE